MPNLYQQVEAALIETDVLCKCDMTAALQAEWVTGNLDCQDESEILAIDDPGRPAQPPLVDPRKLERRSVASDSGRVRLLHAIAHIEFNAINIALDAVYRFRDMPMKYVDDWLLVASEEALHFQLLQQSLRLRGSDYGAFPAHRGLWDMVCRTRHDPLHRMALVPRVMEARGLDVTPALIEKFQQFDDDEAVAILQRIYRDEIGHVRIGDYWYRDLCRQTGLDAEVTFRDLLEQYMGGKLRGPFNWSARIEAGFDERELSALEETA